MQSVFYIIPTAGIGGAEKRFIELFCYLSKSNIQFDFHLIISQQLYSALKENDEIYRLLKPHEKNLCIYNIDFNSSILQFQKKLYQFVCEHTSRNDILHFILSFPTFIFPLKHAKTVYSLTESSLINVNFKGKALYFLNAFRAAIVDILDPVVHQKISRYFFLKKRRIKLTPGSFVDTTIFSPVPYAKKENWFVFLGRFFFVKQVIELLQTLPAVCNELNKAGIKDYKFIFLGYGQLEQKIQSVMNQAEYRDLPIEISKTSKPEMILAKSKIFFSVQLRNNYPSKSLLEAMAAGNIPLVTDVGTTRMVASPEFSYYVPEYFSASDISKQLISILSLDEESISLKMNSARNYIINNFTIQASAEYYSGIYRKLV